MPTLTATEARSKRYRLIDEAASSHEPIVIKGKPGSAVLISEPIEDCIRELDWYDGESFSQNRLKKTPKSFPQQVCAQLAKN